MLVEEHEPYVAWALADFGPGDAEALSVAAARLAAHRKVLQVRLVRTGTAGMLVARGFCPDGCQADIVAAASTMADMSEATVASARLGAWVRDLEHLEDPDGQAEVIVQGWVRGEGLNAQWQHLTRLRTVTREQVVSVTRRLLGSAHAVTSGKKAPKSRRLPQTALTASPGDGHSQMHDAILAMEGPYPSPRWLAEDVDYEVADGGRVIAVRNPSTPLFAAKLAWRRGWRQDPALCRAADRWNNGLWRKGVTTTTRCTEDELTIELKGPMELGLAALRLTLGHLAKPRFDDRVTGGGDNSRRWYGLFRDRSPYLDAWRTKSELDRVPDASLVASLRYIARFQPEVRWLGPEAAWLVARWTSAGSPPIVAEPFPERFQPNETLILVDRGQRGWLSAVRAGSIYDRFDEAFYQLYEAWLIGSGGALFDGIRTRAGAAYAVHARFERGLPGEPNVLSVSLPTGTGATDDAAVTLLSLLRRATVTDAEWASAQQVARAQALCDVAPFREIGHRVRDQLDHGLTDDPRVLSLVGLEHLTKDDFEQFLAREAHHPAVVFVESGDVDVTRLRPFGTVQETRASDRLRAGP